MTRPLAWAQEQVAKARSITWMLEAHPEINVSVDELIGKSLREIIALLKAKIKEAALPRDISNLPYKQLRIIASSLQVVNYSRLTRGELEDAIARRRSTLTRKA